MVESCAVDRCGRPVFSRGWCSAHYFRWRKHGDVRAEVPVGGRPAPSACSVSECARHHYSGGYCELHYRRRLRTGDVRADEPPRGPRSPKPCAVASCSQPAEARGWCHGHYLRWRKYGEVKAEEPLSRRKQPDTCTVEGCGRGSYSAGLCRAHYRRLLKHGDPLPHVPIREATGDGGIHHGYRNVSVPPDHRHLTNGESWVGEHRLVMALHLRRPLYPDEVVHHINGIRTDNRIENLELWSTGHPKGQRVEEKVAFALEILRRYEPDALRDEGESSPSDFSHGSPEEI